MLSVALRLANRGLSVFPLSPGTKVPALKAWPAWATTDPAKIQSWWSDRPDDGVGIHAAGLLVLDVDVKGGAPGYESLMALELKHDMPATAQQKTKSGGLHLLFRAPHDVPNSAGKLGPGLDVRGRNGYIVAYDLDDAPIADAPEWLLELAGRRREKPEAPAAPVIATADDYQRAVEYAEAAEPAVQGAGGDAHTFAVACKLRDFGLQPVEALAVLAEHFNDRCEPPWSEEELHTKVRNAYTYAQNPVGVDAVAAAMSRPLRIVGTSVEVPTIRNRGPQRLKDFAAPRAGGPGYLVKGLLNKASYAVMAGQPGAGKTFAAVDIAYHVAAGLEWMDRRVKGGTVLYLAYEGAGGLRQRAVALRQKYGDADVPLYFDDTPYNLRERDGRQALGAAIAELPEAPALIVIDTFAHALCGGDENSAQDVGAFNAGVAGLIQATGACVLVLHHPPKSGNGLRGSGALLGAVDTEIQVANRTITATKQRDLEVGAGIGFKLVPVVVGQDEDGDPVTTCVVEPHVVAGPALPPRTGVVYAAVQQLCDESEERRDGCPAVTREALAAVVYETDEFKAMKPGSRNTTLRRELKILATRKLIGWTDAWVWDMRAAVSGADFDPRE